jgi:multisubunit Na+/H+ antiporter MnhC subunit
VGLRIFHFWFPMGRTLLHTALEWSLTVLAFIGLYLLYFRHRAAALLILALWLLYPPVYYIMLWSSRYRYPLNWTLILTAAVALEFAVSAVTARRNPVPRGAQ